MRSALVIVLSFLLCFTDVSFGQKAAKKITITGKVTDAGNKPVAGASIFIDKVKTGQVTDVNGIYRVKVKPGAREILVFTLLNGAKEELIDNRTEIDIKLTDIPSGSQDNIKAEGDKNPAAVNKNAGKKDAQRSSSRLDFKDSKVPVYQDIYDMIRGRLPGVEVSGKSIKIRGANSLNVSTEPLFVVDGVIVNGIDDVAPETVKSIEVLKGPDATAYGTRGSNGVIIITRRTGKD